MGSRLFSNTTNLLGGHSFTNEDHRNKISNLLEIPVERVPQTDSLPYHQIIEQILRGKIRGLWVIATNPAHSWINQNMCKDVLDRLDFLVVQDMYATTETANLADMILPAAGWGEKEGTFINSERRIGLVKKVARPPGQALPDFDIFRLIAHHWGCGDLFQQWDSPENVFQLLKQLTKGQPCDISAIRDYQQLDSAGGIQWPYPESGPPQRDAQRRLFADGKFFHQDGRARFIFEAPRRIPESPNDKYPYLLLTGRGTAAQWHTQTRTSKSQTLRQLYPRDIYVELNPDDVADLNVQSGDKVVVASQRGSLMANVVVSPGILPGQAFIPMHYEETNLLTHAHFDPYSSQPSYKDCAVLIRKPDYRDP